MHYRLTRLGYRPIMLPPNDGRALKRTEILIMEVRKLDKPLKGYLTYARSLTQHSFIRDYPVTLISSDRVWR